MQKDTMSNLREQAKQLVRKLPPEDAISIYREIIEKTKIDFAPPYRLFLQ